MKSLHAALLLLLTPCLSRASGLAPNRTTTAVWQSNATNTNRASDTINFAPNSSPAFKFRPLGTVPVKGRAEPVEIFAVDQTG